MAQIVLLTDFVGDAEDYGGTRYLGPYLVANRLRESGYSCVVVDHFTRLNDPFEILENLIGPETLMVGLSGTFLSADFSKEGWNKLARMYYYGGYLWETKFENLASWLQKLRNLIEKRGSRAKLVLGGTKGLIGLQNPELRGLFDYYVLGQSEKFIVAMVKQLEQGLEPNHRLHLDAKFCHSSFFEGSLDLRDMKSMDWREEDFIAPNESLSVELAKGCLYNCKFCHYEKSSSIRKDAESLRAELIRNWELFGTTVYQICDDCLNDTRDRLEAVCSVFLSLPFKIEWVSFVRVDVACRFPETLDLMVQAGARGLFWGIETLNHAVGKKIGKGSDPERVKAMLLRLKNTYKDQVINHGSFIIGLPGESEESIWRTIDWVFASETLDLKVFHPLSIRPYSERLDKAVIDYADFSRNPEKFGFKEVTFNPYYWRHDLMDSNRCYDLIAEIYTKAKAMGSNSSYITEIFTYPHLRTLGLTHQEIAWDVKSSTWGGEKHMAVREKHRLHVRQYESRLLSWSRRNHIRSPAVEAEAEASP